MAPQVSLLSLKLNPSLKPLLPTLLWMILGMFLLLLHPLTTSSLKFELEFLVHFINITKHTLDAEVEKKERKKSKNKTS